MSIAQRSVACEGGAHPGEAETPSGCTDADAADQFRCDTTNLPWVIFRAAHRAAHIEGLPARARAVLSALARTVDAERPFAAVFARRELLTGRALQSMRTFYRSLDDLEAAGLIQRPPQRRYGEAGLFGRAYLHLTEKTVQILGFAEPNPAPKLAALQPATASGASPAIDQQIPSATMADGAIYKDLYPASQKRQPGTLPADLQRLTSLGFHKFLIFKLMREAKDHGKLLSDVVEITWGNLTKAHAPINYLRTLISKPLDFTYQIKAQREAETQRKQQLAEDHRLEQTIRECAGLTLVDTACTSQFTVSADASMVTVYNALTAITRTIPVGSMQAFAREVLDGHVHRATEDDLQRVFQTRAVVQEPWQLSANSKSHLGSIKNILRSMGPQALRA